MRALSCYLIQLTFLLVQNVLDFVHDFIAFALHIRNNVLCAILDFFYGFVSFVIDVF